MQFHFFIRGKNRMEKTMILLFALALSTTGITYGDSVDGNWGEWLEWDPCSASCGEGESRRIRFCNNPPPRNGGALCAGRAIEYQKCEAPIGCPVDGEWSEWSPWTPCSVTCGEGIKSRQRNCDSPPPANGGRNCDGSSEQRTTCASGKDCPRDGGWSNWSKWSPCSVTCGRGFSFRYRECDNPPPSDNGKDCAGRTQETRECTAKRECADTPVCTSPPDIEGAITPHLNHPVGTSVTYTCPYGIESRNSSNHVSVCTVNPITGRPEWTAPEMSCIVRPGYIEVENINITVLENVGTVLATLNRVEGADGIITVQYRTVDGTARAQTDYEPVNGVTTFNGGEKRKTIAVTIIDDSVWEPTEIFQLQFFNTTVPSDVINFRQQSSTLNVIVNILDNDMKPGYLELEQVDFTVKEDNDTLQVGIVRIGGTDGILQLKYKTVEAEATAELDYVPALGELIFEDGELRKTIDIIIVNDDIRESLETFELQIYDLTAGPDTINFRALGSRLTASIKIIDDDARPGYVELEHVKMEVREDFGTLQVNVIRIGGTDGILNLKYKTLDVSAAAQLDYVPAVGDLVFKDGESKKTINIFILNDDVRESLEDFQLQIFDITPGPGIINFRSLGTKLITHITIIDADECGTNRMGRETRNMPLVTAVTNATEGTWPWMASIQRKDNTGHFVPWSTGFLIDKKHVVTVAVRISRKETNLYRVLLGSSDGEAGKEYFITRIVVPRDFTGYYYHDNIGILTLSRDVDIPNFVPVCLPDNRILNMKWTDTGTTLVGWGNNYDRWGSRFLMQLSGIHVLPFEECETRMRYSPDFLPRGKVESGMFCAGYAGEIRDGCWRVEGGPLMLLDRNLWYAVGVASYSAFCRDSSIPATYAKVTSYLDWIKENTRD